MELPIFTSGNEPDAREAQATDEQGLCEYSSPQELLAWALERFEGRDILTTSAFGMEGCALIDMISRAGGGIDVVYLDTHFFFPETLALRDRLIERYPNMNFVNGGTDYTPEQQERDHGPGLWKHNPDLCCQLRKVEPMKEVMRGRDIWITGLRRSQSAARASLKVIQWDWKFHVLKFSPLAHLERADIWKYVQEHDVPFNELHLRDYPTVGCTHCTQAVPGSSPDQYSRSGRWAGTGKSECGLHFGEGI